MDPRRNVHLQLRCRVAQRRERGNGGDLALTQRQPRAAIDVAKAELDDVAAEVGRNVGQGLDHALAGNIIDFLELLPAPCVAVVLQIGVVCGLCGVRGRGHVRPRSVGVLAGASI